MKLTFVKRDDGWTDVCRKVRKSTALCNVSKFTGDAELVQSVYDFPETDSDLNMRKFTEDEKEELFVESNLKANKNADVQTYSRHVLLDSPSDVSCEVPVPWIPRGSRRNLQKMSMARKGNYVPTNAGPGYFTYGTFGDFGLEY